MADDGSGAATARLIETRKAAAGHRLAHVWQENHGFRAAEIRNRAILASRGAYCIFLDGDCIVRPDYVAIHLRLFRHSCICRLRPLRKLRSRAWRGARSCNRAIWDADLDRVDGFDADYNGWGKEVSDILVRLLHAGVHRKDGVFATGVLHLWHPEADRSKLEGNERKLSGVVASDRERAQRGLSSLHAAKNAAAFVPSP